MSRDSSAKHEGATAPQSPIVQHLGFIKALCVVMAILIVVALVVIVVTIYGRLTEMEQNAEPYQSQVSLPAGARVIGASISEKGQMLLLIELADRQQIWQYDQSGRLKGRTEIRISTP